MFTDEDKSFYDKIITSVSEQQIEGDASSPTDVPSQKESGKLDSKEQEEGRPPGELGTGADRHLLPPRGSDVSPCGARGLDCEVFS